MIAVADIFTGCVQGCRIRQRSCETGPARRTAGSNAVSALWAIPGVRVTGYDVVRVVLGSLLLVAALLKGYQLATDPLLSLASRPSSLAPWLSAILDSRWFLIAVVEFELLFGLWLIAGLCPRQTWFAALACFALFACVSLYKALSGESTCGCFGKVPVNPWHTLGLDCAALAALAGWRPSHNGSTVAPRSSHLARKALTLLTIWLCVGAPVGLAPLVATALRQETFPIVPIREELDLGTIWASGDFSHTLHLRNVSSREVEIADVKATCGCTAIDPPSLTIQPGKTRAVTLKFHVSDQPDREAQPDDRRLRTYLVPSVTGYSASGPPWELTGVIRKVLSLSPSLVSFEEGLVVGQPFPVKAVRITARRRLQCLDVQGGDGLASLDLVSESETAYLLRIRPRENLPPGPFRFEVTLTPRLASGERGTPRVLGVHGCVRHEVDASPRALHWGIVPVGETLESRVVLHSLVGSRLQWRRLPGVPSTRTCGSRGPATG